MLQSITLYLPVDYVRYLAVVHVAQQLLLTASNLKGSPHSYEFLHFQVLHFHP